MTIYYYEGSPIVAPLTIESNEPLFVTDSISLKQQRVSQGAQRWELSFSIVTNNLEADYFLGAVLNAGTAKTMPMPQLNSVVSSVTSTVNGVIVSAVEGASTITAKFTGSAKLIPKGSFVKFSNHDKVYVVTANVTTNTTGVAVPIYPKLRSAVPVDALLYHPGSGTKPVITYYRSTDNLSGIIYEDGRLMDPGVVRIIEAV